MDKTRTKLIKGLIKAQNQIELVEEAWIKELIKARDQVEEAELALKERKAELAYIEEVFWLSGEKKLKSELGTVSIIETKYAHVSKKDFASVDKLLMRVFSVSFDDYLEKTLTLTNQKRLAKLLDTMTGSPPDFVKIFPKPTVKLRKKKKKNKF